tara:strand:- start:528 stop:779 length:252 start_codon:yes stop_codon:yes gene_type:complete
MSNLSISAHLAFLSDVNALAKLLDLRSAAIKASTADVAESLRADPDWAPSNSRDLLMSEHALLSQYADDVEGVVQHLRKLLSY